MNTSGHSGPSAARILSVEQSRRLLEAPHHITAATPREWLRRLAAALDEILGVKAACAAKVDGNWVVLAESRGEPRLPLPASESWAGLNAPAAAAERKVQIWHQEGVDWTLVCLGGPGGARGLVIVEGDWTSSAQTFQLFAQNVLLSERTLSLSSQVQIGAVAHRLARRLGRTGSLKEVCAVIVRFAVRAVPSRLAAFAVPTDQGTLAIVATHGYPVELVQQLRIAPGSGVIGSVYQKGSALCVPDVTLYPALGRNRPRYRTNSFVAVPVSAGADVLGVMCLADRLDDRPFTRDDLWALRTLTAPAALALRSERSRRQADEFARAAIIDPVSGLFNRRYFHTRLEEELQRARRQKTPVGLLMIDIDDFKRINDRFGHLAGDAVIRGVADILKRSVRKFDLCARFGGEEFAIVMPGSGAENAGSVAERIRQRIEEFRPDERALGDLRVTASIGLSVAHDVAPRDLIVRADEALYGAKRAGKNRVIGWSRSASSDPV